MFYLATSQNFIKIQALLGPNLPQKDDRCQKNSKIVVTITFRMFYLVTVPYFNKISTKLFLQATEPFHFHQHLDAKFWTHATHAKILLTHATHAPTQPTQFSRLYIDRFAKVYAREIFNFFFFSPNWLAALDITR